MSVSDAPGLKVKCGTHGERTAAVVCIHLLEALEQHVGFVENSSDPDDLQAWCDACERLFVDQGDMTALFHEFNRMQVVCDFCYVGIKARQMSIGEK